MATTPVHVMAPSGLTLTLELYPRGSDTIANGAGDTLTEQTNRKGVYIASVTEALTGHHYGVVKDGSSNVIAVGTINLEDTTTIQLLADAGDVTTQIANILTDTGTTLENHLTDIKGTAFVKDTHSLVQIEGYADLIDDATSGLAKIATDVAEILVDTGTTIPAALGDGTVVVGTLNDGAIGAAAVADIFSTTTIAEAYAGKDVASTPAGILYLILQHVSDVGISGTTKTVRNFAGVAAATYTLDDATTPTDINRAT